MALRRAGFIFAAVLVVGLLCYNNFAHNQQKGVETTHIETPEEKTDTRQKDRGVKQVKKSKNNAKKVEEAKEEEENSKEAQ